MKPYILLRDNEESGPLSFDELQDKILRNSDLIWIEGQSTTWKSPAEVMNLEAITVDDTELNENNIDIKGNILSNVSERIDKTDRIHLPQTFSKAHNAAWLACLLAGLLISASILKSIADALRADVKGVLTTAAFPANEKDNLKKDAEENLYRNALTTEFVPVDTVTMKQVDKKAKKFNIKRLIRLDANDYHTDLSGGIKNLRLLLTNHSAYILDKVNIELHYLKQNGDIIKKENLCIHSINAKSSKSLKVPANKRGVDITYHITNIQLKQSSNALLNL